MKALTLHQPWATAIELAGKRIENRGWRPPAGVVGRRIAIHAGRTFDEDVARQVMGRWLERDDLVHRARRQRGVVVCLARVVGVVEVSDDPWFVGPYGWVLEDVMRLTKPVKARGRQGLWDLTPDEEELCLRRAYEFVDKVNAMADP